MKNRKLRMKIKDRKTFKGYSKTATLYSKFPSLNDISENPESRKNYINDLNKKPEKIIKGKRLKKVIRFREKTEYTIKSTIPEKQKEAFRTLIKMTKNRESK